MPFPRKIDIKLAIKMRDKDKLSYAKIAEHFGVYPSAVFTSYRRATDPAYRQAMNEAQTKKRQKAIKAATKPAKAKAKAKVKVKVKAAKAPTKKRKAKS